MHATRNSFTVPDMKSLKQMKTESYLNNVFKENRFFMQTDKKVIEYEIKEWYRHRSIGIKK